MARFLWWLLPKPLHVLIDKCIGWVIVKHIGKDAIWYTWMRAEEFRPQ